MAWKLISARCTGGNPVRMMASAIVSRAYGNRTLGQAMPSTGWRPVLGQDLRRIDWAQHDTADILRRVRSADGAPGALAPLFGEDCRLFDGHEATADEAARADKVASRTASTS